MWGTLKSAFGWDPVRLTVTFEDNSLVGAQVLFRRLPFGLCLAYIPKGPVGQTVSRNTSEWGRLWRAIDILCRNRKAVFLSVEPDFWEGFVEVISATSKEAYNLPAFCDSRIAPPDGFRPAGQTIQPPRTLLVDLQGSDDTLLGRMKQKTRYNIRLAIKKGVIVKPSNNVEVFYRLATITSQRDAFGVHTLDYYQQAYDLFHPLGKCELFIATYQDVPLAGLIVFAQGRRAWYFYGASSDEHREMMPTYLIQWEAMLWARTRGCIQYDLWGVPDAGEDQLETSFDQRSDGLWGVYRFKRGFGGQLRRAAGPWDRVYHPFAYTLYRWWLAGRKSGVD